ncbi:ribosome biogenesis protein SLX9-domain-containing protein [Podospora fimiseda]|uniref:Ribosome biogenesis protein SLX9 n=1 Tax=Podospora fimiseda TaxID=252190 RepID=A0AAN7GQT3_9PEZI|nr:ribosome biogenesis protein SLX9-domain-containing protein [Podospora fimiseda]
MAPTAPTPSGSKRPTARQKAAARLLDPLLPRKLHRENNHVTDSFINSKRDKRTIKHSAFVSKISSSSSITKRKTLKGRRPNKKLVTTLNSLGDALDDITQEIAEEDAEKPEEGKVRHKSLKSKPGALKKKEKVIKSELERFGRNLAQLAAVSEEKKEEMKMVVEKEEKTQQPQAVPAAATSNRWAALRGFIASTMEQNPAFTNRS